MLLLSPNTCLAWSSSSTQTTAVGTLATRRRSWHLQWSSSSSRSQTLRAPATISSTSRRRKQQQQQQHQQLQATSFLENGNDVAIPLIVVVAVTLGVAANTWINQLVTGKNNNKTKKKDSSSSAAGLGNFLRDGSGYNKSAFQWSDNDRALSQGDPLPWLKLPRLDYVSVAGQEKDVVREEEEVAASQLEAMRIQLNQALDGGNVEQAERLREELEYRMQQSGMEFRSERDSDA